MHDMISWRDRRVGIDLTMNFVEDDRWTLSNRRCAVTYATIRLEGYLEKKQHKEQVRGMHTESQRAANHTRPEGKRTAGTARSQSPHR